MIVDTSALVAILRQEHDAHTYDTVIATADRTRLSAASYLETGIVIDGGRDPVATREVDRYIEVVRIEVVPLSVRQARIARQAYRDFGRGSGHPAELTFGDCFAYALATDLDEPLLFKGDDFGHTDVRSALAPR